jgi:hypothetical protein
MKFIVTTRTRDSYYSLPREKKRELLAKNAEWIDRHRKAGKLELYLTTDLRGAVNIWDVESSEEAARLTLEYPLAPFTDFDPQPVVEWEVALKVLMERSAAPVKAGVAS